MASIVYEKDGTVGILLLAKPPHNLMDNAMLDVLASGYARAVGEGCRAVLLRSSMRHFCAGVELGTIAGGTWDQDASKATWESLNNVPIAADTASFGMAEASLGLLPLLGGVQRVVQRANVARAKEMAMLGRYRVRARSSTGRSSARSCPRRKFTPYPAASISLANCATGLLHPRKYKVQNGS